jgi:hypothetical protein
MYAIEFETKPENGRITIPEIYRKRLDGNIKVIILKQEDNMSETSGCGKQMADILQSIADNGGLGIADPVAWQQEIRCDRLLPRLRHNAPFCVHE